MAIASLFGPTPQQVLMARQKEAQEQQLLRNQQIAQQGQQFGVFAPLYQAGLRFGDISAQAAMQRMFPQQMDPALQQASAIQSVLGKYQGEDLSSPETLTKIGRELMQVAPDAGLKAMTLAGQLGKEKTSPFAKIDPKDYTADSLRAFAQTGDVAVLTPREKPTARYRTLSPAEARARGLNPDNVYQLEEGTEKVTQIGQGPSVVFNAPLVGAEKAYAADVGKANAQRDLSQFGAAEAAVENLNKLNTTLEELKSGEAFTGAFAELQTNIQKVQAKFAADKKAGKRVSDTEYLDALLGSDVFPMIGALGIGARGLDTPAERDFLRQVMTGTIKLERDTLIRLTEDRKKIAERAIDRFNDRVEKGELNDFFKYQGTQPRKFEKPKPPERPRTPAQAPAGVDQRIWNAMTPEEKALWQR
jgi:hypothetical protein